MSGAVMNYDFGPKRHWRRWVWNRISERLMVAAREAVCLYLPGSCDFDRTVALSKGFRSENLIGIEHDMKALASIRSSGVLTVGGGFSDCVFAASKSRRIDVVFGDFCSGLDPDLTCLAFVWNLHPNLQDAVFAFNLLRGRDKKSNAIRSVLSPAVGKHRGKALYLSVLARAMHHDKKHGEVDYGDEEIKCFNEQTMPEASSYKSTSGQIFDSIVWRGLMAGTTGEPFLDSQDIKALHKRHAALSQADRAVAAVWAHRTRRLASSVIG